MQYKYSIKLSNLDLTRKNNHVSHIEFGTFFSTCRKLIQNITFSLGESRNLNKNNLEIL